MKWKGREVVDGWPLGQKEKQEGFAGGQGQGGWRAGGSQGRH